MFLWMLVVALAFSAMGFKKYIWFISIGYGASIAAIGAALLIVFHNTLTVGTALACVLFIIYGCRLGGYLAYREFGIKSYNEKMKTEIKDGKGMPFVAKCGIWVSSALLYALETCPVLFRLENGAGSDSLLWIGICISICGLILESAADLQKNAAKKVNAKRFVDTGLFRLVRCPNYFGEMVFWTGVFVGGLNILSGVWQWIAAVLGYIWIIYVMFSGARRLELRQQRTYGENNEDKKCQAEYLEYVKKTPILLPFIPLYSVAKYKWLVA